MAKPRLQAIESAYQVYRLDAQARLVTDATLGTYTDRIEPFIKWCDAQGKANLSDVDATLLRSYLESLQARGLSSHTVNGVARALKAFLNFCVSEGLITESPFRKVSVPKPDKKIMPSLSTDDVQRLFAICDSKRGEAILLFLLDTGVRAGEFVHLDGGDIDMTNGSVSIRQGKGRKDRLVYLGLKSRRALLRYYLDRGTPGKNDAVWVSEKTGERLTESGLRQILKGMGKGAGVARVSPHAMRRTFALQSLRNGMSIYHLQRLMGHADLFILKTYLNLVEGDAKLASAKFRYCPSFDLMK